MRAVVFLRWPEPCFRANAGDLDYLRSLLPPTAEVIEAKTERQFLKALPEATHAIVWYFREEWFARAPKLKAVATPAAGRELVALDPTGRVQVRFGGFHGAIMSESAVAFILGWARGFFLQQPEAWPRKWMGDKCREVAGSKAIILGFGKVGQAIGEKLTALGVEVEGYSRHRPLPLGKLDCDWFVLALPGDTGTDDLIDAKLLARLPRRCVIVNVGRGNCIDEAALARALKTKRLAGAYLDVLKYEPHYRRCYGFSEWNRKTSSIFLEGKIPNAIVMPHAAAFSPRYVQRCFEELKRERFFK